MFNLLAFVALCHADLTVKNAFVCSLSTHGKIGKALLSLSWLKALTDKVLSEKSELSS